jgi:hypothetical protein
MNGKKTSTARTFDVILVEAGAVNEENVSEFAGTLSTKEIMTLIQEATRRNEIVKMFKADIEKTKTIMRHIAEKIRRSEIKAEDGSICKVSPSSKTVTGTATELIKLLKEEGKLKYANDLLGVKLTEAKKYLGEKVLLDHGFINTETTTYGSVSFKEPKK